MQSLKREHFTYSDLKIEILLIQRLVVMSLSKKKNNFLCHSSDFWDRVGEFRGQTERYIHPGEYVGHRRR